MLKVSKAKFPFAVQAAIRAFHEVLLTDKHAQRFPKCERALLAGLDFPLASIYWHDSIPANPDLKIVEIHGGVNQQDGVVLLRMRRKTKTGKGAAGRSPKNDWQPDQLTIRFGQMELSAMWP